MVTQRVVLVTQTEGGGDTGGVVGDTGGVGDTKKGCGCYGVVWVTQTRAAVGDMGWCG